MTEQLSGDARLINKIDNLNLSIPRLNTPSISETSSTAFEVVNEIKKLDIITPEEIRRLKEASAFALSNFRDVPTYRPMIVKLTSVLNDANFPTIDKKYWQCKIEAEVHFNELIRNYFKYDRSLIDLRELDYKINEISSMLSRDVEPPDGKKLDPNLLKFDQERLQNTKSQYEYELKLLEKDIKYRIQEVVDWSYISEQIAGKCEFSTTNYQEHTIKGHILLLQNKIKDPKISPEEKRGYQAQLDTFSRLNKSS
jgi:hypothetical protein